MDLESIAPYERVYKDDFKFMVCAKDALFETHDKYGDGKFSYEDHYNISIIHYTDMIPPEDQETMTQKVCYDFCRTIPEMGFFGIIHGRDCYCAPFIEQVASDSSECDLSCPGSPAPEPGMCGGETKSALFEMHMCASTAEDMFKALSETANATYKEGNLSKDLLELATGLQSAAQEAQDLFGSAGDPVASNLMQEAKVWAGTLEHAAEALTVNAKELDALLEKGKSLEGSDFTGRETVVEAEKVMNEMDKTAKAGAELYATAAEVFKISTKGKGAPRFDEYYPLMYFVDKKYDSMPSTCGGTWDSKPIFGVSKAECAMACDMSATKPTCVGFFFPQIHVPALLQIRIRHLLPGMPCVPRQVLLPNRVLRQACLLCKHQFGTRPYRKEQARSKRCHETGGCQSVQGEQFHMCSWRDRQRHGHSGRSRKWRRSEVSWHRHVGRKAV
jgi:hypothetical protein